MIIKFADDTTKPDVINIWHTCFPEDSDSFLKYYFTNRYKNAYTIVCIFDDKVVACLQMLPFNFSFYNNNVRSAYISGAATLPEYRNMGIMKSLLRFSFNIMLHNSTVMSTLIPAEDWLVNFYDSLGYSMTFQHFVAPAYSYNFLHAKPNDFPHAKPNEILHAKLADIPNLYFFYNQHFVNINLCVQKSYYDFRMIVEECIIDGGEVLYTVENNVINSLCFVIPNVIERSVWIKDLIANDNFIIKNIIEYVLNSYPDCNIQLSTHCDDNITHMFKGSILDKGMARIIDAKTLLSLYAKSHPDLNFTISVNDSNIPENNCSFKINNSFCNTITNNCKTDYYIDITSLTKLILGTYESHHPYMSLMME